MALAPPSASQLSTFRSSQGRRAPARCGRGKAGEGSAVPPVLIGGNHAAIARWRLKQSLGRTWQRRPDLLERRVLSVEERKLLAEYQAEQDATPREQGQNRD